MAKDDCKHCKKIRLIKKYMPSVVHEALTSAINSGIIEEKVDSILKKLLEEEHDCCD